MNNLCAGKKFLYCYNFDSDQGFKVVMNNKA